MNEGELEQCYLALGVQPGVSLEELERAFMKRNFALIKGKSGAADVANPELDAQRAALRAAYDRLAEHLREQQLQAEAANPRRKPQLVPGQPPPPPLPPGYTLITPPKVEPRDPADNEFILFRFDSWALNTFAPPLLLGLVFLVNLTPLKQLLTGFHVWMHEFGHAVPAWLAGWRATPLPIGWTPVEPVHSNFVYFGLLSMFVILFLAGLKERKVWPMLAAVALAGLQAWMTWRLPEFDKEFYMIAGGVGGEFYLSTLFMMSFWVQLPEKFKWGACRYVFFLIGATAFLNIWMRWGDIHKGLEEIPFGSMINGEEDEGGDMNKLMDQFGWKKVNIRNNFYFLGQYCWAALAVMWLLFVLRLNKAADWVAGRLMKSEEESAE